MQFTVLALTSLLALASAAPALVERRFPSAYRIITPSYLSSYTPSTGALDYDPPFGLVRKPSDKTTLLAFNIPSIAAGQLCTLHFYLDPSDPSASFTPNAKMDLFDSLKPAPEEDRSTWGPGNQRNQYLAQFRITAKGEAGFSTDVPNSAVGFTCPPAGKVGYELVGVGDSVEVKWGKGVSGAYLTWETKY
jgi:hypothetical protein